MLFIEILDVGIKWCNVILSPQQDFLCDCSLYWNRQDLGWQQTLLLCACSNWECHFRKDSKLITIVSTTKRMGQEVNKLTGSTGVVVKWIETWRNDMERLSALVAGIPLTCRFPSQMEMERFSGFFLSLYQTKCWTNNPIAGDLSCLNY